MQDVKYCYPNSDVLINKLGITDGSELFEVEKELTSIRLKELQDNPIKGNFNFKHLKAIHKYIFQDLYEWAGEERTVEIGKGNLFCTTQCIQPYAQSVFEKYYRECNSAKSDFEKYVNVFSNNYGDLNALHPFREGNGRAQREFARLVCLECGYYFDLSNITHKEMVEASILSFNKGDNSQLSKIFTKSLIAIGSETQNIDRINILTIDDLIISPEKNYSYYDYSELDSTKMYNEIYINKINKMNGHNI